MSDQTKLMPSFSILLHVRIVLHVAAIHAYANTSMAQQETTQELEELSQSNAGLQSELEKMEAAKAAAEAQMGQQGDLAEGLAQQVSVQAPSIPQ